MPSIQIYLHDFVAQDDPKPQSKDHARVLYGPLSVIRENQSYDRNILTRIKSHTLLFPRPSTSLLPQMDKLSNVLKFKAQCPFLGSAKTSTLRTLCTRASPHYPSLNRLTEKATGCPVMGPVLTSRSRQIAAGYASVAGNFDVKKLHQEKGVDMEEGSTADIEKCPHASAALSAARMARELSNAQQQRSQVTKPAGCPFHNAKPQPNSTQPVEEPFNYEKFYGEELDKKRADSSYRYFNNINRMAQKFPLAHTGKATDQVEVWCANDYLGMGNNPVVLETIQ